MKISARNKFEGEVIHVEKGNEISIVKVMVDQPGVITAIITTESVDSMDIKPGDTVSVAIKSSNVIILKE